MCDHLLLFERIVNGDMVGITDCTILHGSGYYCYLCPECKIWINHNEIRKIIEKNKNSN